MTVKKLHLKPKNRLRQQVEKLVIREKTAEVLPFSADHVQKLLYELKVHQLDLEMQNEELRRSQHELEISRGRYRSLYDLAPIGYLTINVHGFVLESNFKAAALLGVTRNTLLKQPLSDFIFSEDQDSFYFLRNQLVKSVATQCLDFRLKQAGESVLWVHLQATPIQNREYLVTLEDITERKQADDAIKQAHAELEKRVAERTMDLQQANEQMQKVSFELVWAEERERERIAGELHDQVGQSLLLAKLKLDALSDSNLPDSLRDYALEAGSLLESSIRDIRSFTFRIRPPILDTAGIETAMEWLCSSLNNDYNMQIHFTTDDKPKPLSPEIRYSLYQAVRELLLNVVKHAGTEKAELSIKSDDLNAVVHVTDNGVGFDQPAEHLKHIKNGGYGLYNVRQRVEQMGGCFTIESETGAGTYVTLTVPLTSA